MHAHTCEPIEPDPVSTGGGSMGKYFALGVVLAAVWNHFASRSAADSVEYPQLEEIIVTAALRPCPLSRTAGQRDGAGRDATLRDAGQQHFEDVLAAGAESQLGRRHLAAALLPDPRHRRAAAVPGRAQSFGRISHRRHRFQRLGHRRRRCSTSTRSKCCAARKAPCTAPTRWPASSTSAAPRPPIPSAAAPNSTPATTASAPTAP